MPRVPYVPADISDPPELIRAICARRGGELLHLDRSLLHSPVFAEGWNLFLGVIRSRLSLPARMAELSICAVGYLNRAHYEVLHHTQGFLDAGGTRAQLEGLVNVSLAVQNADLFDASERAILHLVLAMTRDIEVSEEVFAMARQAVASDQELVELVGVIATYNMVSRFVVALDVGSE